MFNFPFAIHLYHFEILKASEHIDLSLISCYLQALPLVLDKILNPFISLVMSVTFVLAFGEVSWASFFFNLQFCEVILI